MEYITVLYSLKNDEFIVNVEDKTLSFSEKAWNDFLDGYGTNIKPKGKRLSGTDQVDKTAFKKFTEGEDNGSRN